MVMEKHDFYRMFWFPIVRFQNTKEYTKANFGWGKVSEWENVSELLENKHASNSNPTYFIRNNMKQKM